MVCDVGGQGGLALGRDGFVWRAWHSDIDGDSWIETRALTVNDLDQNRISKADVVRGLAQLARQAEQGAVDWVWSRD
jgi:hypothetical protein